MAKISVTYDLVGPHRVWFRKFLLRAWRRALGPYRFVCLDWWRLKFGLPVEWTAEKWSASRASVGYADSTRMTVKWIDREGGQGMNRRCKIVYLDEQTIVEVFNWCTAPAGRYLCLPTCDEIPVDVHVEMCFYSAERRALGFMVTHPSFEEVAEGAHFPAIPMSGRTTLRKEPIPETVDAT